MKIFYLQVDENNIVRDAISYPYENYVPYEAEILPVGVNGGWFKLENGILVEFPELKPKDKNEELETEVADLWYQNMVSEARIEITEQEVAGLWYEIMTNGGM